MINDLISRQAAIDALEREKSNENRPTVERLWANLGLEIGCEKLKTLPSAQPEQKKGKWIIRDNPGTGWYRVTCSECGEDVTSTIPMIGFFPNAKPLWDYCPYCGAKMEGHDE